MHFFCISLADMEIKLYLCNAFERKMLSGAVGKFS